MTQATNLYQTVTSAIEFQANSVKADLNHFAEIACALEIQIIELVKTNKVENIDRIVALIEAKAVWTERGVKAQMLLNELADAQDAFNWLATNGIEVDTLQTLVELRSSYNSEAMQYQVVPFGIVAVANEYKRWSCV